MITPLDIQNKEFSKAVRGYKEEEVDMFLDLITLDLEKIVKENVRLKAEVAAVNGKLEKYKGSEGEVVKVLEKAQALMKDISASAEKRSEVMIKNAQLDAELTVRQAKENAFRLREENDNLRKHYTSFRDRYVRMLKDEMERFENVDIDMQMDQQENNLSELLSETEKPAPKSPEREAVPEEREINVKSFEDILGSSEPENAPAPEENVSPDKLTTDFTDMDDRRTMVIDLSGKTDDK